MNVQDILLDDNYDLLVKNGDFVVGDSDQQSADLIFQTYIGHWKENMLVGVGVEYYLNAPGGQQKLIADGTAQLRADGYFVNDIVFKDGQYYFDGYRIIGEPIKPA